MKFKIIAAFIMSFICSSGASASQFCYRDMQNELICARSMEELPAEFQKKAFYLDLPASSGSRPTQSRIEAQPERRAVAEQDAPLESRTINGLPAARTIAPPAEKSGSAVKSGSTVKSSSAVKLGSAAEYPPPHSAPVNKVPIRNQPSAIDHQKISKKPAPVKIIVAEWCGYCRALEKFLRAEGVPFESLDVDKDQRAAALYQQHGSLPISQIGETLVVGFDPDRYRSLLEANLPY